MSVLALVPARSGSRGVPNKNFRRLPDGTNCVERARDVARALNIPAYLSTDCTQTDSQGRSGPVYGGLPWRMSEGWWCIPRPPALAADDTPMVDVVIHALSVVPDPPDQIIVLLQPTAALRTPAHVQAAIDLLQSSGADSVVSVVELPKTHHPDFQLRLEGDYIEPLDAYVAWTADEIHGERPTRRQVVERTFIPDGTCYCFFRKTVDTHGTMYGRAVRPLIIPAVESCELDTPEDWERLEARIRATMKKDPAVCVCDTPTPHTRPSGAVICVNDCCGGLLVAKPEPVARP